MLLNLGGRSLHAQRDTLARVRGAVYDSLARRPLAGARIEMARIVAGTVERPLATAAASNGAFEFHDVPHGRYLVVFRDAALDTLGLETAESFVDVRGNATINLATPSPETVRRALCAGANAPTGGLLFGHLLDAGTGTAIRGGAVDVYFTLPKTDRGTLAFDERLVTATTSSTGWFAVCALPTSSTLTLRAKRFADTTGSIEATIPPSGIRHVSIYVAQSANAPAGRLRGVVRDDRRQPIANAQVTHLGTYRTATTDETGRFALDSLPEGTQSFEFRAIGRSPGDTTIRIERDRPSDIEMTLAQVTTLPTVVATASARLTGLAAFEHSRRSAAGGYFIKPHRLEGYPQMQTVRQLIQGLPGLPTVLQGYSPKIFINGRVTNFAFAELEVAVDPATILAIEVYKAGQAPVRYRPSLQGHPPVLSIWTDETLRKPK
jgi:hypothetical protein